MVDINGIVEEAKRNGFTDKDIRNMLLEKGYSQKEIGAALGRKGSVSLRNSADTKENLSMMSKVGYLFTKPNYFFDLVKSESASNALVLYLIVGILAFALSFGLTSILGGIFGEFFGFLSIFGYMGFIGGIVIFIFYFVMSFIFAGIVHLMILIMKGERNSTDTYKVVAYSAVPFLILNILPLIGFLGGIYSIVLMTLGLSKIHNISKGKAVVAALFPLILIFGLLVIFIIWAISAFRFA